ncbi:glycosyltransferase family 2 protein [Dyadobacter sp. CY312]|uniref:glycosyltransferase family 2 protein n=1 Tax=Dyadobacter sp. CY312 TaxID=2907303 RepID=UPI001F2587D0|nr:glycosyltransferase family 2 protein [Dyadobacter sp. CY312]MCE7042060.1 glycosyltransferase family 2 protein [Dyadobacter sp. CY312]
MVSVAMCTYNGAKYLPEQLESIANQTIPVEELVVCDDGSTDNTIEVIKAFAQTCSFPVAVHSNAENLGSTKNFEKCLNLCAGDIIFLCDQDDKWREDKVEKQLAYFKANPDKDAVFSDAMMIDNDSKPIGRTIWEEIEFTTTYQKKWLEGKAHEILFNGFVVTGATLAIRKSSLERLMPFPTHVEDLIHDAWMAMVLSLEDKIGFIAENLISYRRHESQQVGFGSKIEYVKINERFKRPREEKLVPIKEKADKLHGMYLLLRELSFVPREKLIKLYLAQNHFYRRASLPENRFLRISPIFHHVLKGYYIFSSKDWWLPAIGDLIE